MTYYVYIIKCEKWIFNRVFKEFQFDSIVYYTGMTSNPRRRLLEHKQGKRSNWMQHHEIRPLHFIYLEEAGEDYEKALEREKKIKRLSHEAKRNLGENYL